MKIPNIVITFHVESSMWYAFDISNSVFIEKSDSRTQIDEISRQYEKKVFSILDKKSSRN